MDSPTPMGPALTPKGALGANRIPPHPYFVASAIFHYLGPSFAVLSFARIEPLGVVWPRIASAALIFAVWRRPWRYFRMLDASDRRIVVALGVVLAARDSRRRAGVCRFGLLAAAVGVGISSSVIPYVTDQLPMARPPVVP